MATEPLIILLMGTWSNVTCIPRKVNDSSCELHSFKLTGASGLCSPVRRHLPLIVGW